MDVFDYAQPLPTELEQIVDEAREAGGLGPVPRGPGTGVADMDVRIEYHTQLLARLRKQMEQNHARCRADAKYQDNMRLSIAESELQLKLAQGQRREYQLQQTGANWTQQRILPSA